MSSISALNELISDWLTHRKVFTEPQPETIALHWGNSDTDMLYSKKWWEISLLKWWWWHWWYKTIGVILLVSRYLGQFIEVTSERLYQNIPNLLLLVNKVLRFKHQPMARIKMQPFFTQLRKFVEFPDWLTVFQCSSPLEKFLQLFFFLFHLNCVPSRTCTAMVLNFSITGVKSSTSAKFFINKTWKKNIRK